MSSPSIRQTIYLPNKEAQLIITSNIKNFRTGLSLPKILRSFFIYKKFNRPFFS